MIECKKINESCVRMKICGADKEKMASTRVQLENGITAEEFIDNIEDVLDSKNKLISLSHEDVGTIIGDKSKVFFGRIHFFKSERFYTTFDSLEWLRKLNPLDVCLFVEGNADIMDITDIVGLLGTTMNGYENANVFFSFMERDIPVIKVGVLAG